ncbi:hypothetical protein [Aquimarina algiphila]|uniref:Uncharacterized protein n=1 Tax=Aquimarina algiphila TaxID=2047982 RepID=A0A554VJ50_9FLAO|nr:hypothetical protein [Aquimarina algiphila]TSE07897.1 hypothetical protein FOF46_14315 [Aquimarina algiphila]
MKKFKIKLVYSFFLFCLVSCKSQIILEEQPNELQSKILYRGEHKDSCQFFIMFPKSIKIINETSEELKLTNVYLNTFKTGMNLKDYKLLEFQSGKLVSSKKRNIPIGEELKIDFYYGYFIKEHKKSFEKLFNLSEDFLTYKNSKLYDLSFNEGDEKYLKEKINDSIIGKIFLQFTDKKEFIYKELKPTPFD